MSRKPKIAQVGTLPDYAVALLEAHLEIVADGSSRNAEVVGIATTGRDRIDAAMLDRLPNATTVSSLGAGIEAIDAETARSRGIAIATPSAALADDVADVAMGLILSVARGLLQADAFVRAGSWSNAEFPLRRRLRGAKLGILGMGTIGGALALRAAASGMVVGYHNRRLKADSPHRHFASPGEMAGWCDYLAICAPGGAGTRHAVGRDVLRALGPEGYLVNIGRGSVVDEAALVAALDAGEIAGAGLDVFETEPHPLPGLLASSKVHLLPHMASATRETRLAMAEMMVRQLRDGIAGQASAAL